MQAANDRVQATQGGKPIQTDLAVYSSLVNQANNDPDGFLRRPLTPYLSKLSDNDWNDITSLRDDLAKKRDGVDGKAFQLSTMNSVFTDGIKGVPELNTRDANGKELPPARPSKHA